MLSYWRKRTVARPWVSMVAAFAFALQALLGTVLLAQAAALDTSPFVICVSNDDGAPDHGGTGKSPPHDHCVLCALGQASLPVLGGATAAVPEFVVPAKPSSFASERVAYFISPTGHYQRGPPPPA